MTESNYFTSVSSRVSARTSETGSRPSVRQTHPFHSSVYRHHPSPPARCSYLTRRRGPPAGVYSTVNPSDIEYLRRVVGTADALPFFAGKQFGTATGAALSDAEHLRAPLGDCLDEALGRVGAVLPADATGDEVGPLAERGARLDVDDLAIIDDPHRVDADALAVVDPALGVGAGVVGVDTAVGKFLSLRVVSFHWVSTSVRKSRPACDNRREITSVRIAPQSQVFLSVYTGQNTIKPLFRVNQYSVYVRQNSRAREESNPQRHSSVSPATEKAVYHGQGCEKPVRCYACRCERLAFRDGRAGRDQQEGRRRFCCRVLAPGRRRLRELFPSFVSQPIYLRRRSYLPRIDISKFQEFVEPVSNPCTRHIHALLNIFDRRNGSWRQSDSFEKIFVGYLSIWPPLRHMARGLTRPVLYHALDISERVHIDYSCKVLSSGVLIDGVCDSLAGPLGLAKTNRPGCTPRPASGSYVGQPMQTNERRGENASPTNEFVEACQDPETEQFILSGSKSIHEEIRSHATIDLMEAL